uniref:Doublecortin domain-containing protein n=2 Tax=Dendroctonus ponderosae TaxID=77166 RepID=A0AAR5Q3F7_DENPD
MPAKPRAWQTLDEPKCGKPVKITVWKNQDFDCPGQEITLHPKFLKSWTGTLGLLTCVLQPRFGAVRKLYHLDTKKLVLCLKEIRPNGKYVAVGAEKVKFRKNGYVDESKMKRRPSKHDYSISISDLNLIACTKRNKRTLLYIMVSGRACQLPSKVVLIERDLMDYDMVLDYLGHRLDVGEGIQYLCSIDGKPIHDPSDLLHGQLYVAVPHASSFIQLDYLDLFSNLLPSIRLKAAKPKRSKSQQARSEEDIDKTGVDGNSQQEGELSKIASQTSKQASRSQEHSKGECELQEIDGKMSKSGAKASKSISKEDGSKHVEVQVGEYPEDHPSGYAFLQAKCVGAKCIDQDCRVFRKEYPSLPASFFNMHESPHHLAGVTVENIMSEVIAVRNFLDSIVDHTMEQVKRRGVATQSYSEAHCLPIIDEEEDVYLTWPTPGHTANHCDESVTTMELAQQERELTTFADIARNKQLDEEVHPLFAFDTAFPNLQIPEAAQLNNSHRKGVSFMQIDSPESGLVRDTQVAEKELSSSNEFAVGRRRSLSNVFVQQAAKGKSATEDSRPECHPDQRPTLACSEIILPPRSDAMVTAVQPKPPLKIDKRKFPRMSILRSKNNSPLKVAQELETHLPVVVQSSFVSIRSSIVDPQADQMKQNLSRLLEKGVDVVSDDEFDVIYEEDSLSGHSMLSKGIQKDWKLNEDMYERAVQTGIVEALDDVVEAASQASEASDK